MRINPILTWEYGHVWHFLRTFNLPYCCLYDQGYTSLGRVTDTRPNPALRRKHVSSNLSLEDLENSNQVLYWPAYMLADWSLERAGRGNNSLNDFNGKNCSNDSYNTSSHKDTTTAGMIIIGDEILNGMTADVNMQITSLCLKSIGIPLRKVVVVLDEIDEIVEEVRRMSQTYDIVITSGGIGPTHDDVTIKAVAKALGQEIKCKIIVDILLY